MTEDDEKKFVDGADFDDWFEKNEDLIRELLPNDAYELLWQTWFAGYNNGLTAMAQMVRIR